MKVSAKGMLTNAADELDGLKASKHPYAGMHAYSLREFAENLERLGKHPELLDSFLDLYCLKPAEAEAPEAKAA